MVLNFFLSCNVKNHVFAINRLNDTLNVLSPQLPSATIHKDCRYPANP